MEYVEEFFTKSFFPLGELPSFQQTYSVSFSFILKKEKCTEKFSAEIVLWF